MRAAEIIRAAVREIYLLALIVVLLLAAMAHPQPDRACTDTQGEARP